VLFGHLIGVVPFFFFARKSAHSFLSIPQFDSIRCSTTILCKPLREFY
jgi:hypothetical protein